MSENKPRESSNSLLGVPMEDIANLSVDEIVNNKPAVTMIFHYYRRMEDENTSLKNERNTLQTYVDAFNRKKSDSATAAILLLVSNIIIGFGINLLTDANPQSVNPGWILLVVGIIITLTGLYFQFLKDKSSQE